MNPTKITRNASPIPNISRMSHITEILDRFPIFAAEVEFCETNIRMNVARITAITVKIGK